MLRLIITALLIPSIAFAKDDVECAKKHDGNIHCNFKVDTTITRVITNDGECDNIAVYRKVPAGYHWIIPASQCLYVSKLTLYTDQGKIYTFVPL